VALTPEQLMEQALKYYSTRYQRQTWEQDSADHREIVNLVVTEVKQSLAAANQGGKKRLTQEEKHKQRRE
jgi:hypothetical protein